MKIGYFYFFNYIFLMTLTITWVLEFTILPNTYYIISENDRLKYTKEQNSITSCKCISKCLGCNTKLSIDIYILTSEVYLMDLHFIYFL